MTAPRVLVTRAAEDAEGLSHLLAVRGYAPVRTPLLLRRWCVDEIALAAQSHPDVDVVLVTSAVAADVLAAAAPTAWSKARFAAVGPATAARLRQHGFPVHVTPRRALGMELVAALGDVSGLTVVYPRSEIAPAALVDALRSRGAVVYEVTAYTNVAPPGHAAEVAAALPVHATALLSGSAARRLVRALPGDVGQLGAVVAIGPSTAAVCRTVGLPVHAVASTHTVGGLLDALAAVVPPPG
ncbi:MAG: uroporphyrinogen-III synthase [Myxococcota bacterium]